ncbi:ribosome maturation factor RimM [Apilactobacillus micheneri]|uniref:Ribosome maturation factor RimM n=1 Tax=Apilactobacillus micheneri TaxID=1899430 RepID=A0A2S2JLD8_9LACO|nr:ribosome maturation factor RimM [Apilactobacillus micheneri]TPR40600.1 ribosome maturation factor RimM [Apilactobacillus micheneri]TPR42067.1 ribosome maturation factor RimM [Apilactobacillus micheneri]TPR44722.1 ribosome maturation factor RimM [Apilactobacillus micheneri]TPR45021.1 ribosome maturation factor RimM [Apilactobacillus micheneri]TPR46363.1 ribosome maturation factor RimM [Apilactobacillus micheneri]
MNYYNIGKIVNTQGIKGEVRVTSITDFPKKRFKVGNVVYAFLNNGDKEKLIIDSARKHKNFILLHFEGKPTINDVEYLKPSSLKISEDQQDAKDLKPGEYFYHQIIGLDVIDINDEYIGKIKDIMSLGPNDVWVVERKDKEDLLLPKIDQVIKKVDLENSNIIVEVPGGLDDEN